MRTTTAGEDTILSGSESAHHLRVEIKDAGGTWVAYDALSSLDWQDRVEIQKDVNQRVAQATIRIFRESDGNSLAPLINSDIDAGRAIRISAARVAIGTSPVAGDYKSLFLGEIDRWDAAADPMELVARDDMGHLADRWVETETEYGSADGRAIETVMADILTDWTDGRFTLYTPTSPGFLVTRYLQQQESVLSALQALADLIGWVIDYEWDDGTSQFRLTFSEPDRSPVSTDWTFGADDYYDVTRLSVDRLEIRNVWSILYTVSATETRSEATVEDATSISKYGRRWAQIQEADDSPIDTDAEATTMITAALDDTSTPVAEQEIETDLFWPGQLGDFYGFTANDVHYDTNQEFAATGFAHVFEAGRATTRIQTRGAGAAAHTRGWIKREQKKRPDSEAAAGLKILDFREITSTDTTITYGGRLGTDLDELWLHYFTEPQPVSADKWPATTRPPDNVLFDRTFTFTIAIPSPGDVGYLQVEGRKSGISEVFDMIRVLVRPTKVTESEALSDGVVIAAKVREAMRSFITDVEFSAPDWDTVDWTSGTLRLSDGTEYSISAGSTGNLGSDAIRFVYFDKNVSTTAFQTTLATTDAVGEDALIMAVVKRATAGASSGQLAFFVPSVGTLGLNSDGLGPASVITDKLAALAVTTAKVAAQAIETDKLADLAVSTAKIATGAVTEAILAAGAITTTKITDGAISTPKLAAGAVTAAKITAGTITSTEIASATIVAGNIAAGTITGAKIAAATITGSLVASRTIQAINIDSGTITANEIAAATITATQIASDAITSAKIQAGAITTGKLAAGAVTANEINVTSLSAISADMGTITAGTIDAGTIGASVNCNVTSLSGNGGLVSVPNGFDIGKVSTPGKGVKIDSVGDLVFAGGNGDYTIHTGASAVGATEAAWVQVTYGAGSTGYIRIYAAK